MGYLKLCQIMDKETSGMKYLEAVLYKEEIKKFVDAEGNEQSTVEIKDNVTLINKDPSLAYPLNMICEVIDFVSYENYLNRKSNFVSFHVEEVTIDTEVVSMRDEVFRQLSAKYPELIK